MLWSTVFTILTILPCILSKPTIRQRRHSHGHAHLHKRGAGTGSYTVVGGDTGNIIAAVYSITFSTLSSANPNVNWNGLQIGQVLNMPSSRMPNTYLVNSGDSSASIARTYNVYSDDLVAANPSLASGSPQPGSTVRVPGYGQYTTYKVVSGDYGYSIAQAFGISFDSLSAANPGVNWSNLQIGQVLSIPAGVSPSKNTLPSPAVPPKTTTTTAAAATTITTTITTTVTKSTTSMITTTLVTSTRLSTTTTATLASQSTATTATWSNVSTLSSSKTSTSAVSSSTSSTSSKSSTTTSIVISSATSSSTRSSTILTTAITSSAAATSSTTTSKVTSTTSSVTSTSTSFPSTTTITTTSVSTISRPPTTTSVVTTTAAVGTGEPQVTPTTTVAGANYVAGGNDNDGVASRADTYTFYQGDGSTGAGWPSKSQWISFSTMWKNLSPYLGTQCQSLYNVANNSPQENQYMYNAIQAVASNSGIDHRLILATIIQESSGCVRVKTTVSPDGTVTNPGLMQDFNGSGSCNRNGVIQNPCPASQIYQMIEDGVFGTSTNGGKTYNGGLVQDVNSCTGYSDAQAIYRAARTYNSGSVPSSNDLGAPGATRCYVSDITNRLMGWTSAKRTCTLDG